MTLYLSHRNGNAYVEHEPFTGAVKITEREWMLGPEETARQRNVRLSGYMLDREPCP